MSTHYSQQANSFISQAHDPLKPNEMHGRKRICWFEFNTTDDLNGTDALAEADVLILAKIPAGARILGGYCTFEAMGTDQQADLGLQAVDGTGYLDVAGTVADDPDFFTTAPIAVAAAGESDFGVLQEDNFGYVTEKEVYLTATLIDATSSDPWAADKDFQGIVNYVVD